MGWKHISHLYYLSEIKIKHSMSNVTNRCFPSKKKVTNIETIHTAR